MPISTRRNELSYAVRLKTVLKFWGQLCVVTATLTLVPLVVSLASGEFDMGLRYVPVIVTLGIGGLLLGRMHAPERVQRNEALVIVALAFLSTPLAMSWPMMASGLSFIDAFFEAVSGVTTTGLSTTASVEDKPTTFLFARAWMQWYGGLGVMVLALAMFVQPGLLAKRLAIGEVEANDPVGGTRAHFRRILIVYVLLTGVGGLTLCLLGLNPFHALLYTFAAVSTGGYAPHDGSLASLPGSGPAIVISIICVAASLSLMHYHRAYRKGLGAFFKDLQLQALVVCILFQSIALAWSLRLLSGLSWAEAAWHGPMMAATAQTTAGFSTIAVPSLDPVSKLLMMVGMFVGGGVGSTAGGVKLLRLLILFGLVRTLLRRTSMPTRAVLHPQLGGSRVTEDEVQEALTILALTLVVGIASWLPFIALGYEPMDALFEVVSATGTVGVSAGLCGPELPSPLKLVLCADMLLGRLETVAWLVLFYPRTWVGRRKRDGILQAVNES